MDESIGMKVIAEKKGFCEQN